MGKWQVERACGVAPFLSLGVYSGQGGIAPHIGPREMAAVRFNPELVECSMPVRLRGTVLGGIRCVERSIGAMIIVVKVNLMTLLICPIRCYKSFALSEVWSAE